jgi:taurine dioxygenase
VLQAIRHEPQAVPESYSRFELTPLSGALGATITGLDLRQVDSEAFGEIRRAFARHLVLFFPGQNLTPEAQEGFACLFGDVTEYPFVDAVPSFPKGMIPVGFQPGDAYNFGGDFHSDASFLREPPLATMLSCQLLPRVGGDTVWVNQYLTYRSLSPAMQKLLDGLRAVHSAVTGTTPGASDYDAYSAGNRATPIKPNGSVEKWVIHPAVRTHPETGEKALYVNESYTIAFEGMTLEESWPLLQFLFAHQKRPDFSYRHRWQVGELCVWDNRCTLHHALNDYPGEHRMMHRLTVGPERPA